MVFGPLTPGYSCLWPYPRDHTLAASGPPLSLPLGSLQTLGSLSPLCPPENQTPSSLPGKKVSDSKDENIPCRILVLKELSKHQNKSIDPFNTR